MAQVGVRFDIASAAGQHQAVNHCTCIRARNRTREQPILATDRKRTDIAFDQIVIDGRPPVIDEAVELQPLPEGLADRFADQ